MFVPLDDLFSVFGGMVGIQKVLDNYRSRK